MTRWCNILAGLINTIRYLGRQYISNQSRFGLKVIDRPFRSLGYCPLMLLSQSPLFWFPVPTSPSPLSLYFIHCWLYLCVCGFSWSHYVLCSVCGWYVDEFVSEKFDEHNEWGDIVAIGCATATWGSSFTHLLKSTDHWDIAGIQSPCAEKRSWWRRTFWRSVSSKSSDSFQSYE